MPNCGPTDAEFCCYFKLCSNSYVLRSLVFLAADKQMISEAKVQTTKTMPAVSQSPQTVQYEFIDSGTLARRWSLPKSWICEQVRSRSADPLPHVRLGKYVRFRWGSPELEEWMERRIISASNRKAGRILGKDLR